MKRGLSLLTHPCYLGYKGAVGYMVNYRRRKFLGTNSICECHQTLSRFSCESLAPRDYVLPNQPPTSYTSCLSKAGVFRWRYTSNHSISAVWLSMQWPESSAFLVTLLHSLILIPSRTKAKQRDVYQCMHHCYSRNS